MFVGELGNWICYHVCTMYVDVGGSVCTQVVLMQGRRFAGWALIGQECMLEDVM